ncbi:hypothetical protein K2173_005793 [Erythroxylum novogranatense]|uniref:SAM domain-containing protein n=1 Tax=Erythroxylum novogranatense TaxID=1862640 RepID=A0AAV8U2P2_9ROSI|nr:hypothetical protein K2173_005793 [Erythroxylum novogranatense]
MAADLHPPETPTTIAIETVPTLAATAANNTINNDISATTTTAISVQTENAVAPPTAPKRQRRPSVRLGEIGDQPVTLSYDSHPRRTKHPWRLPRDPSKAVKARSLINLVNGNDSANVQEHDGGNQNGEVNLDFGHRKKAKRGTTKRVRSNWILKVDEGGGDSREDGEEGFRDSDSPSKDPSPVHSVDYWNGQRIAGSSRVRESRENEMESRDRKCSTSDGVRTWLIELGLSRYAPVFEIHEVDDEVLPLLTLEDLKDMGINAVGSRRKLYSAIQKLRKGFS